MEPPNFSIHNWVQFDSYESQLKNPKSQPQIHNHDDGEEALSLCDLATGKTATNHPGKQFSDEHQEEEVEEDFDFNGTGFNLPENIMCSADEVFFRGKILPFRHSVSLPSGFMTQTRNSISFSRSESVSLTSSRSSSTRSHNSGTSGSNSPSSRSEFTGYKPTIRNRNQFHSHPSPTPQIRTRSYRHPNPKPSPKWSFLQLGLLKPQEIGLADLKNRSQRSHGSMKDENQKKTTKHLLLFGGCKCSANVVENTVSWRIPMVKPTTSKEEEMKLGISKEINVGRRKDGVANHRTSEWLKQLSIEESAPL